MACNIEPDAELDELAESAVPRSSSAKASTDRQLENPTSKRSRQRKMRTGDAPLTDAERR